MPSFARKATFGLVAISVTAATAFMTASAATAAPTTQVVHATAAQTAKVQAATAPTVVTLVFPLVVQGNTGERVIDVQQLLNQRIHAGLAVDGIFGPLTNAAVRNFQASRHILVDGKVGNQTWPLLIIQVQRGSTGPAVSAVQHNLRFAYGFTSLAVDGIFGPQTQAAVQSFQARFHIGVDGIVGPITWNTLLVNEK
jgi:peptidoglycan hydrolase-like protein with peptidoglycan-binding domain